MLIKIIQTTISVNNGLYGIGGINSINFYFSVPIGVLVQIATLLNSLFNNGYDYAVCCVLVPKDLLEDLERKTLMWVYYYGVPVLVSSRHPTSHCGLYEDMIRLFKD